MANLCMPRNPAPGLGVIEYPKLCFGRTAAYKFRDIYALQKVQDIARTMSLQNSTVGGASESVTTMQAKEATSIPNFPDMADQSAVPDASISPIATIEDEKETGRPEHSALDVASAPQYNIDMDSLAQRMHDSVVIKDMPIKNSRWIQVPKGYLVDLEIRPAKHYKARGDIKTQIKKRKREAMLPETSQRGWREEVQGFRPEEMVWNGAIGFKHCEPAPSSLTNGLHPLFDRSCFDDTPDAIYDQLIPGLQLATLFLTQPICMQFWVTLAMGKRRHDPKMSASHGRPAQRIGSHVELTEERAKTLIELIHKIGKDRLVHFRFNSFLQTLSNSKEEGYAYGISAPICDYKGIDTEYHGVNRSLVRSIIRFHADYYIVAKKLSQLKFPEMSQKLRFSFGFAVLIVHELAHSIEGIHFRGRSNQWIDFQQSGYYREPYWLDWDESECGRAWEQTMFGGHLQPTNGRVDGSHGIAVADWPFGDSANKPSPKSHRWWTVSMDYIVWMFRKETWEQRFDLKDWHVFNIPRDGATSLCINSFTTMDPSEEWRVAKEEAAALVALLNAEPANKKRVKALGDTEEKRPEEAEIIKQAIVEGERKATDSQPKRQVPMFPGSRRLSSVMPGPLPDDQAPNIPHREKVILHTRKPSKDSSTSAVPLSEGAFGIPQAVYNGFTPRQLELLEEQKDDEQHRRDEAVKEMLAANRPGSRQTTSELIKEFGSKPLGILEGYKRRKKVEMEQNRVDEERRHKITEKLILDQREELIQQAMMDKTVQKQKALRYEEEVEERKMVRGRRDTAVM